MLIIYLQINTVLMKIIDKFIRYHIHKFLNLFLRFSEEKW